MTRRRNASPGAPPLARCVTASMSFMNPTMSFMTALLSYMNATMSYMNAFASYMNAFMSFMTVLPTNMSSLGTFHAPWNLAGGASASGCRCGPGLDC
jgi:hypothetical protein